MKTTFDETDISLLAEEVVKRLAPLLSNNGKQDDTLFDVEGLAGYLGTSKKWIYSLTSRRCIPFIKANGLLRFRKSKIDKWLNEHSVQAGRWK